MLNLKIFLLALIPLNVQSSYNRRPPPDRMISRPAPFTMPDHYDENFASQLKIPNPTFCRRMALRGPDFYMVMPWWYLYCEGLKEKENKLDNRAKMLKPYKRVLDKVLDYKKRQKIWKEVASVLRPGAKRL